MPNPRPHPVAFQRKCRAALSLTARLAFGDVSELLADGVISTPLPWEGTVRSVGQDSPAHGSERRSGDYVRVELTQPILDPLRLRRDLYFAE